MDAFVHRKRRKSYDRGIMLETFRKFGLGHCELDTMLWNVNVFLRTLTLNIDSRDKRPINPIWYLTTLILLVSHVYVFLFSVGWMIYLIPETGDWMGVTIALTLTIIGQISTAKILCIFFYVRKFRELVDRYRSCDTMVVPGTSLRFNLMKSLRVVKKRAIIYWMVLVVNGILYALKPLYKRGRHLADDNFTLYGLQPQYESPNFEIATVFMTLAVAYTIYPTANIGAVLVVIAGYTEAQLIALSEDMLTLWSDAQQHCRETFGDKVRSRESERAANEYIEKRLRELIKIHVTNIELMQKVEDIYRGTIAIEFVFLTVGIILELLGHLENTYLELPYALNQVAMDCYCGQKVMDASLKFENAIYDSKWENFNLSNRKTVLLMLQMSQKTLTLSAGGVMMLNTTSFGGVLKMIYSSYTALRQMY